MPKLVRFYITHCIIGFALGAAFVAALLWLNVANLWHLISTSDVGLMAVVVFWVLNGIVFAGAQTTVALLLMSESDDAGDTPRGNAPVTSQVPVPVRAEAKARG